MNMTVDIVLTFTSMQLGVIELGVGSRRFFVDRGKNKVKRESNAGCYACPTICRYVSFLAYSIAVTIHSQ